MPNAGLHAVEKTLHVDFEKFVEIAFRCRFQAANMRNSSVIYKDVDGFFPKQLIENSFDVFAARHVTLKGAGIASGIHDIKSNHFCLFLVDVQNSNASPASREPLDYGAPDPAAAPCDDGDFAVQSKWFHVVRLRAQRETPLFHGIKSFWASNSAFDLLSPLAK